MVVVDGRGVANVSLAIPRGSKRRLRWPSESGILGIL
jgi:hypothetical protein